MQEVKTITDVEQLILTLTVYICIDNDVFVYHEQVDESFVTVVFMQNLQNL